MGEEIFRFDVLLTPDKEIEIGVTVKEIEVEGYPEFGEEYGHLAHLYAELVVEHVGMNTEMFMNSVSELQAVSTNLTLEEESALEEEGNGEAVLLYSFPVIIMEEEFPELEMGDALGYTAEMAMEEAGRCLKCKNPKCVEGCPVNVRIPEFIGKVAEGDFKAAYEIITSTNALPALSGRVCPQESQCEARCVRGIKGEPVAIGRLERFVADWYRENINEMPTKPASNGIKVAVVGSGPAGMTAASDLAKLGYAVTMFEALHTAGGVLVYGIPEFRLPKAIVANEITKLQAQGVEVMTNMVIGRVLSIDELFEMGYKAVFVGSGAGLPMFMNIPGESLNGVFSAN